MEHEASLLAGGLIALSAESYGTCARATSRLHDPLLNSVFLSLHGDANAWRHDTEACHLTAGTARCWSRARIRASACVCRLTTAADKLAANELGWSVGMLLSGAFRSAESGRGLRHRRNRLPIIAIDMVNGRGRFDIPARGWRRTSRTVGPQDNGQGDIVTRIVGDVAAGLTVRQIAAERHLPVDFVDMAIERARERGSLDVVDMRSRHACGETVCRPDPASLVCVGCPFRFFPSSDS